MQESFELTKAKYKSKMFELLDNLDYSNTKVLANLKKVEIMLGAKYVGTDCVNVEWLDMSLNYDQIGRNPRWCKTTDPEWNWDDDYRLIEDDSLYVPFDWESVRPHLGRKIKNRMLSEQTPLKIMGCNQDTISVGSTYYTYERALNTFLFFDDNKPFGICKEEITEC